MDLQEARQQMGKIQRSRVSDSDYFPLIGGLNTTATPMQTPPGQLLGVSNYEPATLGGYKRIQGYERFDGRTAPSTASYWLLNFNTGTPANYPVVGNVVTGNTSGATGVVIVANVIDGTGLAGYVVIGRLSGAFIIGENLKVVAAVFGVSTTIAQQNASPDPVLTMAYSLAAREDQRAQVGAVPGSGPVLGVVEYRGVAYAFRNNIGGTAVAMYKATATGWVLIPGFPLLRFVGGVSAISPGDVITGFTSGNVATVARVVLTQGSWDGGTAAGYLILAAGSPAFVNNETLQVAATSRATTSGTAVAPALLPGGAYDFRVKNFYGATGTIRLYGCDGVNNAFEFQDANPQFYCPIFTGMAVDTPKHIGAHRGRLWLAFAGGSLQPSSVNDPVVYSALLGAAEIGVGDEITGILEEMSPAQSFLYSTATLFVFCQKSIHQITGDGPNWVYGPYAPDTGAFPFSVQRLGQGVLLDNRGFSTLAAVYQGGNFALSSFSQQIQTIIPLIKAKSVCSSVSKNRSLYRMLLNDGSYIAIGFKDNKVTGHTICNLGKIMQCAWSGETASNAEFLLFGGTDGFVYQMDSGNNMDGQPVNAFFRTAYHFSKSPSRQKRYRRVQLDMAVDGPTSLTFGVAYNMSSAEVQPDPQKYFSFAGGGGAWDSGLWDTFRWDSSLSAIPRFKLEDSALNVSVMITHTSTNENAHTIQGVSFHHSQRRLDRSSVA